MIEGAVASRWEHDAGELQDPLVCDEACLEDAEDSLLVARIVRGSQSAEALLFARYRSWLLTYLRKRGCQSESEDILHDAFLILLDRLRKGKIGAPERVRYYFRGVAEKLWLQQLRRDERRKRILLSEGLDSFIEFGESPEVIALLAVEFDCVRVEVSQLAVARDRDLLRDYYFYEHDRAALCERYEISAPQLSRVLYRARERLRQRLLKAQPVE